MLTNPNQYSRWFYTSSIQLYSCNNLWLGCNWKLKSSHRSTGLKQLLLTHHAGLTHWDLAPYVHASRTALPTVCPRGMAYIQSKLQVPMVTPSLKNYGMNTSCRFPSDEPDPSKDPVHQRYTLKGSWNTKAFMKILDSGTLEIRCRLGVRSNRVIHGFLKTMGGR